MKRKGNQVRPNPSFEEKKMRKKSGFVGDQTLIPRVEQYLQEHKDQKVISVSLMAECIQETYREYSRRKKVPFRLSVEKAYGTICTMRDGPTSEDRSSRLENKYLKKKRDGKEQEESSEDSSSESDSDKSFSSDNPDYVAVQDTNTMNSFLTNMYKVTPARDKKGRHDTLPSSTPSVPWHQESASGTPRQSGLADSELFTVDRQGSRPQTPCEESPRRPRRDKGKSLVQPNKTRQQGDIDEDKVSGTKSVASTSEDQPVSDRTVITPETSARKEAYKNHGVSRKENDLQASTTVSSKVVPVESGKKGSQQGPTDSVPPGQEGSGEPVKKVKTKPLKEKTSEKYSKKKSVNIQHSTVKFADVGGNDATLKEVCKLLIHLKHPEVYDRLGVTPPRGFLLHGPPGCGKTLLAHAIAGELDLPFIKLASTEIVSGVSGESEEKVREIFDTAVSCAPCVMFLDEIDAITPKRETASKDMERRIVSQLLTCMDDLNSKSAAQVLVIGATNRPDSLDPALRRAGRFDREIALGIPDEKARVRILKVLCRDLKLSAEFSFLMLARITPGYVGADLMALAREAAMIAVNRIFQALQSPTKEIPAAQEEAPLTVQHHNVANFPTYHPKPSASTSKEITSEDPKGTKAFSMDCDTSCQVPASMADQGPSVSQAGSVEEVVTPAATCRSEEELVDETCRSRSVCADDLHSESRKQGMAGHVGDDVVIDPGVNISNVPGNAGSASEMTLPSHKGAGTDFSEEVDTLEEREFKSVLSWLKEQPPLSEQQLTDLYITQEDFEAAVQIVQPSAKREGFATVPDVTWDDIGALRDIREELHMAILAPVRYPEKFLALGLSSPPGVLLAGPPGCGKTLLAKAVANESGINFISVKGPELLNMYVGESERAVRQVFQRARNSCPCVIFFDELDALCPRRSSAGEGGASVRVVNQLLTEMDGLQERKQVFIMAATNRPDIIDPAILRPGRLDKILYVGLPEAGDRLDILNTITKHGTRPGMTDDVDLKSVAGDKRCQGFTGADLAALVREAAVAALRQHMMDNVTETVKVTAQHFEAAFLKVKASVSTKDQLIYQKMKEEQSPSSS